jgi:DNA polymerase-3 subunit gamma/tau
VQTFKLSKISTEVIQKRLKFILDSEIAEGRDIKYTDDALAYIARLANGGMRDAITQLDKALAFDNNITIELLETALDLPSYGDYFNLLNALVKKDNQEITSIIDTVYNSGTNFIKWFEGFHSFLCNIVKFIFLKDITKTMIPGNYLPKLQKYGEQHAFICLKLANLILNLNKELKTTQYLQEVALTYLCSTSANK